MHLKGRFYISGICFLLFFGGISLTAKADIIVHTSDFIPDATRSGYNGFEGIPNGGTFYTEGSGPYTEDGISVTQINGDSGNDIWVTYFTPEGAYGWYPNGGDSGYTRITLSDGGTFDSVGILVGTGFSNSVLSYQLLLGDQVVSSGGGLALTGNDTNPSYIGFSGGGFDAVLLCDNQQGVVDVTAGNYQALAIDGIETFGEFNSVPEPATLLLLGIGMSAISLFSIRKKK